MADTVFLPNSPLLRPLNDPDKTHPNTPRTPIHDLDTAPLHDIVKLKSSPGFSTASDEPPRYDDIQPTWPKAIDITKSVALATWQTRNLPGVCFDIHWHIPSNKAFFQLRANTLIKPGPGLPSGRKGKASIYIFIYPERIRQLSVDTDPAERKLGPDTLTLTFDLIKPPVLVLPKPPWEPKNEAAKDLIDNFHRLASQSSFTIYTTISRRKFPPSQIRKLCSAASAGGLASLAAHANTASLYGGQDGQVLEGENLAPPPAYTKPPSKPSSEKPPSERPSKKRRRSSTPEPIQHTDRKVFQDLLDASLSSLKRHFDNRLAAHTQEIAKMLDQTQARILQTVRRELDERDAGFQHDIDERLQREMAELEETVMKNISEAPLQATLTFPANPWY